MSALLARLLQLVGPIFFNWLYGKTIGLVIWLYGWIVGLVIRARAKAAILKKNKEAKEKLVEAKTPEEIDEAAKNIADKF